MSFRPRRPAVEHHDRHALERAGWRTLLEFRENVVRDRDGALVAVDPLWVGEAERHGCASRRTRVVVATASGPTPDAVWAELRRQIDR